MPSESPSPLRHRLAPIGAVAASFFLYAAIRTPVPGPNEPHYLTKAKHFWNPAWCGGDFFLESADTHRVFYEAFGPLTLFLSLPTIALLGRAFAHAVLAVGWTELVDRVAPGRWTPLWSAWLFLAIAAVGNLSGEWVVGGVEAKVFGYAYSFLALAWAFDRRWIASAITLGFAIAWHPLVGLWSVVAASLVVLRWWFVERRVEGAGPATIGWSRAIVCVLLGGVCAVPGLLPAFELFGEKHVRPTDAPWTSPVEDVVFAADYLQVRYRLRHHLDPTEFPRAVWWAYGALVVGWCVLRRSLPPRRAEGEFAWFVGGTLLIAVGGLVAAAITHPIGDPVSERSAFGLKLLKFYWFRLPDVVVPMAFAIAATGVASARTASAGAWWTGGLTAVLFAATLCFPNADGPVTALTDEEQRDWYAVCDWIREHTPEDARVRTPNSGIAFKWHAARPEFISLKDCPQDAAGIVEWNERLQYVEAWGREAYADGRYSEAEIRAHCRAIDVDWFVAWHLGPIDMEPVFERGKFRVYDVRPKRR